MNEIRKPMSVARQEFIDKLTDDINYCELPMFVIEPILQDVLKAVQSAVMQQYMEEKTQYEQQLKAQSETAHE